MVWNGIHRVKTTGYFLAGSFLFSLEVATPFLGYGPDFGETAAWIYTRMAYLSTFTLHYLVLGLILLPVSFLFRFRPLFYAVPFLVTGLYQVLLFLDVHIFKLFRFHLNGVIWNVISTEGSNDSILYGTGTVLTFFTFVGLVIIFQSGLFVVLSKIDPGSLLSGLRPFALKYSPLILFVFLVFSVVTEKLIYAYSDYRDEVRVTRYKTLFPLYLPLTAKKSLTRYLGEPPDFAFGGNPPGKRLIRYPDAGLIGSSELLPLNIVWIVIESWRFDALNPDNTPFLWGFGRENLVFRNHYSGGNSSRFGVFTLAYGLYGSYWHAFLAERKSPFLFDVLKDRGYAFQALSSTRLTFPEFRKTVFAGFPEESIEDRLPGEYAEERDVLFPGRFSAFLDRVEPGRLFFSFMWLDAPHSPYRYPADFKKYSPTVDEINYLEVLDESDSVARAYNSYRNAVYFSDHITNRIIGVLKDRGLMESTLVVVTGDHGQEFNETGYFGHNSAFSRFQTGSPLILHVPGREPGVIDNMTSHLDVVPTMLELLGSKLDPREFSNGRSLLTGEPAPYEVVSSWNTLAIIEPSSTIVLPSEMYNSGMVEVRGAGYRPVDNPGEILTEKGPELIEIARSLGNFMK